MRVRVAVVLAVAVGLTGLASMGWAQAVTVLSEDFEAWPPTGWTIQNNGGDCVWESTATTGRTNYAGGDGEAAVADADDCGGGTTMDTELITPAMDLSGGGTATLDFVASYNWLASGDLFEVNVSSDGGTTWTNILSWAEDHDAYGPGEAVSLDLTPYASATTLVSFHFVAPGWNWWAEVDQVRVTMVGGGPTGADLAITKTTGVTGTLHPGDQFVYSFSVVNNGPDDATGVTVTDVLPAGLTYVSDTCGGSWDGGSGTWTWAIGALAAGNNAACDLTVEVQAGANGVITNTATVLGNETDPDGTNSTASISIEVSSKIPGIPALSRGGTAAMVLLLAGIALALLRRRL